MEHINVLHFYVQVLNVAGEMMIVPLIHEQCECDLQIPLINIIIDDSNMNELNEIHYLNVDFLYI